VASGDEVSQGAIDDSASFVLHMKSATMGRDVHQANPQLNHYTKPQFLAATATVGDSCYSYADVPMVHGVPMGSAPNQPQLRLTQEHFKQREMYEQEMGSEMLDHNYIYSNTHYSMPLEQLGRSKTPTPPPMPPALPLRNGLCATTGRRSFQQKSAAQKQQQQQNNNTLRQFTH